MTDTGEMITRPIGWIETGFETLKDCPPSGRANPKSSLIVLDPAYEDGLQHIELASHVIVLYWLGKANRNALYRRAKDGEVRRGVFASRSPNRPNPIAISVVQLIGHDANRLRVSGLDCLNRTAVLDIKPYVPQDDCIRDAHLDFDCAGFATTQGSQTPNTSKRQD